MSGLLSLTFFALSIFFTLPSNVISLRDGSGLRTTVVDLAPQNWAFFTKSPRELEYIPYSLENNRMELSTPQTKAENLFGFSRDQRAQGTEIGSLI
ncbi:SdpA family antimicrobial peptide system protein [Corynebacterium kroppenstedtii]|uniref:SdpA family antimicrobial peptide system protein n=1 Tax=Corynebacterium kroppenstedtii TaxID=161879 RepID=UPI0034CE5A2F